MGRNSNTIFDSNGNQSNADSIIERFILFHLGLIPSPENLDESSSLQELCEHILYYYDGPSSTTDSTQHYDESQQDDIYTVATSPPSYFNAPQGPDNFNIDGNLNHHVSESACKFARLCRAFLSASVLLNSTHDSTCNDNIRQSNTIQKILSL